LEERRSALMQGVGSKFAELSDRSETLKEIRQLLNATKYVQGLLRDLRA
jgi:hypothetical protein